MSRQEKLAALASTGVTKAELDNIDGGTARGTTAIADGDGVLINDAGTMRMTSVETMATYIGTKVGGGMEFLASSGAISDAATVVFNQFDASKYDYYIFNILAVVILLSAILAVVTFAFKILAVVTALSAISAATIAPSAIFAAVIAPSCIFAVDTVLSAIASNRVVSVPLITYIEAPLAGAAEKVILLKDEDPSKPNVYALPVPGSCLIFSTNTSISFSVTLGIAIARSKVVVEPSPVKISFLLNPLNAGFGASPK